LLNDKLKNAEAIFAQSIIPVSSWTGWESTCKTSVKIKYPFWYSNRVPPIHKHKALPLCQSVHSFSFPGCVCVVCACIYETFMNSFTMNSTYFRRSLRTQGITVKMCGYKVQRRVLSVTKFKCAGNRGNRGNYGLIQKFAVCTRVLVLREQGDEE
jgi:hypothetical protein